MTAAPIRRQSADPDANAMGKAVMRGLGDLSNRVRKRIVEECWALPPFMAMERAKEIVESELPELADLFTAATLEAYIAGAAETIAEMPEPPPLPRWYVPPETAAESPPWGSPPNGPDPVLPSDFEPVRVRMPVIEGAVADLLARGVMDRDRFDMLTAEAKRSAFTVARVAGERTIETIRDVLAENIAEGASLKGFRDAMEEAFGGSPLSDGHLCFVPGTLVEGDVLAASKIWYDGPVTEIETDDGRRLAVTVNHPVLTPAGWKDAGSIQEGEHLVCHGHPVETLNGRKLLVSRPQCRAHYGENIPSRVEYVFKAIFEQSSAGGDRTAPSGSLDFHGDAAFMKGDIHYVWPDRVLMGGHDSNIGQLSQKVNLVHRGVITPLGASGVGCGLLAPFRQRSLAPENGLTGVGKCRSRAGVLGFRRQPVPIRSVRFGETSHLDPRLFKASDKTPGGDAQLYRKLIVAFPGKVSTHRVVNVKRVAWTGHVYDLQTRTGFIVSQGIVTSNSNVFRTNVQAAYAKGLEDTIEHPMVSDLFPYWRWSAAHDSRTRPNHLLMETLGISGTSLYRRDDPIMAEYRIPLSWNCRCTRRMASIQDAADAGVEEAIEWLKTGRPPERPTFVARPPFEPVFGQT